MDSSGTTSIVEVFRSNTLRHPERQAFTFLSAGGKPAGGLSYLELDRRARTVAARLQDLAARSHRALLLHPPGLSFIEAFWGCLYTGVIAVPAYPPRPHRGWERLDALFHHVRPRFVLTTASQKPLVEAWIGKARPGNSPETRCLATDELADELADHWREYEPRNDDLAFLQYTSGSTSSPKGVMVSHGNLLYNQELIRRTFGQSGESVVVSWLPPYHDMGLVGSVLQPLYVGARCILMSPMAFLERPVRWLRAIDRFRATTSGGPDFAYDLCVRKISSEDRETLQLSRWEVAFNGAEPVRAETLKRFIAAFEPCGFRARAFKPCFGLAEATLLVTAAPRSGLPVVRSVNKAALEQGQVVSGTDGDASACRSLVSSGRSAMGNLVRIVDPLTRRPCSSGQVGEIWVSGRGVARGYWDDPEQTEACFRATLAESGEGPFLRTGDLGFVERGELFVTGRLKDLIIIRGRNHYPQDLERTAERSHSALRPGGAAAFAVEREGQDRLVLVMELRRPRPGYRVAEIEEAVRRALTEEHELHLDDLVLVRPGAVSKTSSGKLRRSACRARYLARDPEAVFPAAPAAQGQVPSKRLHLDRAALTQLSPAGRRGKVIAFLSSEAARLARLPAERIRPEQPLAAAGLDSLMAVELQHAIEVELGVRLPLAELFLCPSVTCLAESILENWDPRTDRQAAPLLPRGDTTGDFPLSYGQRALWFIHRWVPESPVHVIAGAARIIAELDVEALRRAVNALTERHPALRTTFPEQDAEPVQRVHPHMAAELETAEASGWDLQRRHRWLSRGVHRPFDVERGPLLRIGVLSSSPHEHVFYLAVHHLVADFWSLAVLLRDLGKLYGRESGGNLEALPVRYSDYTRWQRERLAGQRGEKLRAFWRRHLAQKTFVPDLPSDRPRPAVPTYRGASVPFGLDEDLRTALERMGSGRGATLFMTLLAVFQALLQRYSGRTSVAVGAPTAGRGRPELQGVVGYFVNSVALTADFSSNPRAGDFLDQVRETVLAAFEHQDCPFIQVVEDVQPERDPSCAPIFQVMLVFHNANPGEEGLIPFALGQAGGEIELGGHVMESVALEPVSSELDLMLTLAPFDDRLVGSFLYSTDLFDVTTVRRLSKRFQCLLRQFVAHQDEHLSALDLFTEPERHQVLLEWNDARWDGIPDRGFDALFAEQAKRRPDAIAVVGAERQLSYVALERRANRVAACLRSLGTVAESRVGVSMERAPDLVAALLGVWKAGAAYVPMDPSYPAERLALIAADARIQVLISETRLLARLPASGAQVLRMDRLRGRSSIAPGNEAGPFHLSHVIYTSGSTGTPKGVAITRRGVAALLAWARRTFSPSRLTGVLASTSLNFDLSVFELFAPLASGGRVVLVEDALALADLSASCPATLLNTVPSVLAELLGLGAVPPAVETIALAGEPLAGALVDEALRQTRAERIYNLYGPSEDTTYSTVFRAGGDGAEPTIGRPIAGTGAYAVDRRFHVVPVGATGELCLAGLGLARGYLDRPASTSERFVPDPCGRERGGRLYRTGDLVRFLAHGEMEFLGRLDHQVKVRGFRIELGEVEAALRRHPSVREAAAAVLEEDGAKRLAALFVPEGQVPALGDLQGFLRDLLPSYMVPAVLAPVDALPRLPNGKVDRRSLPERIPAGRLSTAAGEAPRSPLERRVAAIWAEVLGVESVGLDEDFFRVGGHSLRAVRVLSRLRERLGVSLPVRSLFESSTVRSLAARINTAGRGEKEFHLEPPRSVARDRPLPLSFAQERMWFVNQVDPESPAYNLSGALRLAGPLDVGALARAVSEIVRRHEVLRTHIELRGDRLVQVVDPVPSPPLSAVDLERLPAARRDAETRRLLAREARHLFDLSRGPLIRVVLVRWEAHLHVLEATQHHIVTDGGSLLLMTRELEALYRSHRRGEPPAVPRLPLQYADFAAWQRRHLDGEALAEELAYWRRQLRGSATLLELPCDRPRPARRSQRGAVVRFTLAPRLSEALRALSRNRGTTLFMTLVAAFAALLHRLTGAEDLNVATPVAGRGWLEVEPLIGFFVNTLVLRTDLTGVPEFREHLDRVREVALEAYARQQLPFEKLVEDLQPERGLDHSPLFQVMFVLNEAVPDDLRLPGIAATSIELETRAAKFDWTLTVIDGAPALEGRFEHDRDLFDETTIRRHVEHFESLLEAIVERGDRRLPELPMLSAAERHQVVQEWNDPRWDGPPGRGLDALFEDQVRRRPEAVAVVSAERHVSYAEIGRRAGRLAGELRSLGMRADSRVGVAMERTPDLVVALLGVWKAGAAYVPMDPSYPVERLALIAADARIQVLISETRLLARLPASGAQVLRMDRLRGPSSTAPGNEAGPFHLSHVIYTSGSTGTPKGVAITRRGVAALLAWARRTFPPSRLTGVLASTSLNFDLSVFELFVPLAFGGRVVLVEDALALADLSASCPATLLNTVPSVLAELLGLGAVPPAVETIALAGEPLAGTLVDEALRRTRAERVYNLYGPSEDTTYSTVSRVGTAPHGRREPTIGRPIAGTGAYAVDRRFHVVPVGATGELCLAGLGLARGYLERPASTAERFVPDPCGRERGGRLYRTGDMVRFLAHGEMEFLGRLDHQVKVRGFRIELGEVEAALRRHPGVREAVATVLRESSARYLAAHFVPVRGRGPALGDLRTFLRETLPSHMVPAVLAPVGALPRLPNGKIDRRSLPEISPAGRTPAATSEPPRSLVEQRTAAIWAEVLGLESVGMDDNFFDLGGHSLRATQLIPRFRDLLGVDLPVRLLFERPTIRGLAAWIRTEGRGGASRDLPPMKPVRRDQPLPPSFAQERMWFLHQLETDSPAYNLPAALRLRGTLDVAALVRALATVIRRHEALRTRFAVVGDELVQLVDAVPEPPFVRVELERLPAALAAAETRRLTTAECRRPFDLSRDRLFRVVLAHRGADEHVLLVNLHHIIADGLSLRLLFHELEVLYGALVEGEEPVLPLLPVQYADYAHWQRRAYSEKTLEAELEYWRRQLQGSSAFLKLPVDRPRPARRSSRGERLGFSLPPRLSEALKTLARNRGATLFMTLEAAFAALLCRLTGSEDVNIATPVAGRSELEVESLIGLFVNTLVLRTDLSGDPSFRVLSSRVRQVALEAYARQQLPFEKLVEELRPERGLDRSPLFQVMFVVEDGGDEDPRLPGLAAAPVALDTGTAKFDWTVGLATVGPALHGSFEYDSDLFDPSTVHRSVRHFRTLLERIVEDEDRCLSALELSTEAERHQLSREWNDTLQERSAVSGAHQLFEARAARACDATAVVFEQQHLSYGELDRRADQLAWYLASLGVGAEQWVGISMERSLEMIAGILGILKAGAAYVPLDPSYPADFLESMCKDSRVPVLLTRESVSNRLPQTRARVVCLDRDREHIRRPGSGRPASAVTPANLIYMIYTSGSTGRPKGVMVEHRGPCNLFSANQYHAYELHTQSRVLQFASLNFDASVTNLLETLRTGATLYLANGDARLGGEALIELLRERQITNVSLPPSVLAALPDAELPALVTVNTGGEVCPASVVKRWAPGRQFFNAYGPTEATVFSTYVRCRNGDGDPTLGRPVSNTRVYVLDRRAGLVPVGVAGELHIGGAGLARGYWRRPAETADRFIPDPLGSTVGERLYRTGDLTRLLAHGEMAFLGRIDHQVKVRGFRIELGEIEAALERQPGVAEAVATVRETGGEAYLATFFVADPGAKPVVGSLRRSLAETLPPHEVPATIVRLDALPRLPNGKVDRSALPAGRRPSNDVPFEAPVTPVEQLLAEIWSDLLSIERVGRDDSFFELGGHSILAIRLVSRIRDNLLVDLPLRTVFEAPTLVEMAGAVARHESRSSPEEQQASIPRRRAGDPAPLSFAQQRLWFLAQLDPGSAAYNMPFALRLEGALRVEALERSFREVLRRHEALRTAFVTVAGEVEQEGEVEQVVAPPPSRFPLLHVSLLGLPRPLVAPEVERLLEREGRRSFDLAHGPQLRVVVVQVRRREHVLLLAMHHIASDGWSAGVASREISACYRAFSRGEAPRLPELPVQYADFAVWQRERLRGDALETGLSYWRDQLAEVPPILELPADRPPKPAWSVRGARRSFALPKQLTRRLKALGDGAGASLYMTLLTGWQALLHRYCGQEKVCVGSPVANREPAELEPLIGLFVNTLVLATELSDNPGFRKLLERVRGVALAAYEHRELPFDLLVEKLAPRRKYGATPVFQVMLVLQNLPAPTLHLPGLATAPLALETGAAKFWLTLDLAEHEGGLAGSLEYAAELFDGTLIARMLSHLRRLLEEVVSDPHRRLWDLPLLTRGETAQLFVPDPASSLLRTPGVRVSGTGDRARRLSDRGTEVERGDGQEEARRSLVELRTPVEEVLTQIWSEVLELPSVDVDADFFELGGHSLLAVRVTARIRQLFRLDLGVRALFDHPTVARLGAVLERMERGEDAEMPPIERRRQSAPPLSFAQLRLWFLDRMKPGAWAYNIPHALAVRGRLDVPAFRGSFQELARRHEVLRTVFAPAEPEPVQVIRPPAPMELPVVDLRGLDEDVGETLAQDLAAEEARTPFDLARGPLLRARLVRLRDEEHVLLLTLHHIVTDGWSMGVLVREVSASYNALVRHRPVPGSEPAVQYADFAAWQRHWLRGATMDSELAYWKKRLRDLPQFLELPVDRKRQGRSPRGEIAPVRLPEELARGLRALGRHEGATLFMTLLAAFKILLHRSAGAQDFAVGVPVAGRNLLELEELIGLFVNVLALRTRLSGDPPFRELLARVRETTLEAHAHQHLPFEKLVEELQPQRSLNRPPICQVTFQLQHPPRSTVSWVDLDVRPWPVRLPYAPKLDLSLTMTESDAALVGALGYNAALFEHSTISRMAAHLTGILRQVVRDPDRRLSELSLLPPAERQQLLVEWNDTAPEPVASREVLLHELFEARADRQPDSVALVDAAGQVSFRQLDRRANRLARYLRRSVGPEVAVALCAKRSIEAVVGILGILKSGGVYVPLDPAHPRRRLALLLEQSASKVLVTRRDWLPEAPETACALVSLDAEEIRNESDERLPRRSTSENLAWIFFTSGSTGTPKGVAAAHRGAVSYLRRYLEARWSLSNADTVLQLAALSFDASMRDLVGSLTVGARVVLLDELRARDPKAILTAMRRQRVNCLLSTVPTFLATLLAEAQSDEDGLDLKLLLVAGEPFPVPLYRGAREVFGDAVEVVNQYGPTECTVTSTYQLLAREDPARDFARLGRPVPGARLDVLDRDLTVLPAGARGEMCLGGTGLARGYASRPGMTAAVFVPDPFRHEPGGRLYKTGDLARRLKDGNTEFLGRRDHQVKLRGVRIELGEIESVLHRHPAVRQGVVDVREGHLVGYVVTQGRPSSDELSSFLRAELPAHLVPSIFVRLEALPLTHSRKVDRRALPEPRQVRRATGHPAPRDRTELEMVRIWEEVLAIGPVGIRDDFFHLGGHSLLAVRLLGRIEERFGVEISLATLFQRPTVEELSRLVREGPTIGTEPVLVPLEPRGSRPPLFWVHPVGGHVLCYVELARLLGPEQPFYALQSPGLAGRARSLTTVEEMAACYLEEIRAVQDGGSYRLGGWSMGGLVAFEMARQLRQKGERVSLLTLLDTRAPSSETERPEEPLESLAAFARDLGLGAAELSRTGEIAPGLAPEEMLALLQKRAEASGLLPPGIAPERMRRLFEVFRTNLRARLDYRARPYAGKLVLFRASEPLVTGGSRPAAGQEAARGWSRWVREVREASIPGNHYTVLRRPGVEVLARELEACQ